MEKYKRKLKKLPREKCYNKLMSIILKPLSIFSNYTHVFIYRDFHKIVLLVIVHVNGSVYN